MRKILFIRKQDQNLQFDTDELIKIFEGTDDLGIIKDNVEKAKDRLFCSWATVEMKDKAGELIPVDDVVKQQDTLLERNGPITDEHTNRVIGQTLAWKVLEHPMSKTLGVLHLNKIFNHNDFDDQVWKEIQSGERTGSSIGGFNTSESMGKDTVTNSNAMVLHGFKQFETASVFDPCNPLALNEAVSVVAKSSSSKGCDEDKRKESKKEADLGISAGQPNSPLSTETTEYKEVEEMEKNKNFTAQVVMTEEGFKQLDAKLDNVINKFDTKQDSKSIHKEGENMEENKILKKLDQISKGIDANSKRLDSLEKVDEEEKPKEEDKPEEPVEKQEEEEKPKEEEEDMVDEADKSINKESVAGDIPGESGKEEPESPEPDQPSDKDVFKKEISSVHKELKELKKQMTSRVNTGRPGANIDFINKAEKASAIAMDLATGNKKMTWMDIHKSVRDLKKVI